MRNLFRVVSAAAVVAPLVIGVSSASANSPELYADLISTHAARNGVPVELANAVIRYESNYNPRVTGRAGEIGLMQIKLQTARGIGYRGSRKGLYDPATNIAWGMKYLGQAVRLSGGSQCGTLSRYNAGLFTRRLVPSYCRQVIAKSSDRHLRNHEVRVAYAGHVGHGHHHEVRVAYSGRVGHGHHRQQEAAEQSPNLLASLFAAD
jgi:soluble lytic murein transglycosylase-like protein